jgi:predicted ATP-grasp superfamily ATP-dependent carboligase
MVSDKYSFGKLCEANGISTPIEFDDPPSFYPFVLKPKHYIKQVRALDKPVIISSSDDADRYLEELSFGEYYFQEFVEGKSIYLLFYFFKDGNHRVYSQENLIQQNNGGSIILAKSANYHLENIARKFEQLFIGIGFRGLIMVEVRLRGEEYYMIEANPRLWGPSQLILDSGMDLFESLCQDNELIEQGGKQNYKPDTWYFWSGGWMADLRNGSKPVYHNFSAREFAGSYLQVVESEVYLKPDSINIYLQEHSKI